MQTGQGNRPKRQAHRHNRELGRRLVKERKDQPLIETQSTPRHHEQGGFWVWEIGFDLDAPFNPPTVTRRTRNE